MTGLVIGRALIGVDHHWVLHASAWPVLQGELWELIRKPQRRIELQRVPRPLTGECETRRAPGQKKHVHGHDSLAGNRGASGLPYKFPGSGECEVVYRIGVKLPGQPTVRGGCSGLSRSHFLRADNGGVGVAGQGLHQALSGLRREHFIGVLQHPGPAHDPTGWHINTHVIRAEVVVEL